MVPHRGRLVPPCPASQLNHKLSAERELGPIVADADLDAAALLLTGALHEMALFGGSPSAQDEDALLRRVVRAVVVAVVPR